MKDKQIAENEKKPQRAEPKRIQTAEGKRRAILRGMKGSKKKAA